MASEGYRVQENTGDPAHPSIEDVIELALARAADPRPADHPDEYFDRYVRDAVEHAGEAAVEQSIRLSLTEGLTHRMAGRKAFGNDDYLYGINVGVAATTYLRELNDDPVSGRSPSKPQAAKTKPEEVPDAIPSSDVPTKPVVRF